MSRIENTWKNIDPKSIASDFRSQTIFELKEDITISLNTTTGEEEIKTTYYTTKDGFLVSDTLSYDKETAEKLFEIVVKHNGKLRTTNVLKTVEI